MSITLVRPLPGVLHFKADTQDELCRAFVRLQEFYESPYADIRGKYFELATFMDHYTMTHGGPFSYYTDWHGFNFPSHVAREFERVFSGHMTTDAENYIIRMAHPPHSSGRSYIIGTHQEDDVTHELAHALFYLDHDYENAVCDLLCELKMDHKQEYMLLTDWLRREGYAEYVMDDEVHAYLATGGDPKMVEDLGTVTVNYMLHIGRGFADLFEKYNKPGAQDE